MENLILMIDQFVDKSRKLKVNLENIGYRVIITQNFEEALIMINSNSVNLLIVFESGLQLDTFKHNKNSTDIPILAILDDSTRLTFDSKDETIDDYVFSPFEKEQLYLKIKNLIKINELRTIIKKKDEELKKAYTDINDIGLVDKITGLYNSFYFGHILKNQCASSKRYGYKLSGIMIAIDNVIEDTNKYNEIVKELASILNGKIRNNDILVRLNQKEFYILLPHTGLKDARYVAEKLRKCIANYKFNYKEQVTISAGVTSLGQLDTGALKEEELIFNARDGLKMAINEGGNSTKCS